MTGESLCLRAGRTGIHPALQRRGQHILAREAPPAAAAITAASSNAEQLKVLQPRYRPPIGARATMRSNRHTLRAALSRQSLANPCAHDNRLKFCPQGPRRAVRARVPTTGRRSSSSTSRRCDNSSASCTSSSVRCSCRARPAAACALLSVCCCARRRTVVAFTFAYGRHPGGYRHLRISLHAPLSGHVATGGRGEERGRAARAMRMCVYLCIPPEPFLRHTR